VSLLERLGRGHLSDHQFARLWTTGGGHPHLEGCATCRARYEEFEHWVLGIGDELRAEADEAFPAERLAAQQTQVARRLETLERPARVIAFPKAARAIIGGHSHVRRWVTVAAAAGLIAGIGLDQAFFFRHATPAVQQQIASNRPLTHPAVKQPSVKMQPASFNDDDELLSDTYSRPQISTLSALDDMTPRVRQLGDGAK
jgi:hypothetical protein